MRKLTIVAILLLVAALGVTDVLGRSPAQADQPAAAPTAQEGVAPAGSVPTWGPRQMRGQMNRGAAATSAPVRGFVLADRSARDVIAETLGMTTDELVAALQGGAAIESLAAEKGVAVASIIADLAAAHEAGLQAAVAAGRITTEQAEQMQARMTERWAQRLQEGGLIGGRGPGHGAGPNPDCPLQDGSGNPAGRGRAQMQGRGCGYGRQGLQSRGAIGPDG